jgi:hypothetical protein
MTVVSLIQYLSAASLAVLASCAAPKAVTVADPPKKKTANVDGSGNPMPQGNASLLPQDKIRLPDNFLSMPGDTEFRATAPANTSAATGAVTVRPPNDPVIPPDIGPKTE